MAELEFDARPADEELGLIGENLDHATANDAASEQTQADRLLFVHALTVAGVKKPRQEMPGLDE